MDGSRQAGKSQRPILILMKRMDIIKNSYSNYNICNLYRENFKTNLVISIETIEENC